MNTLSKKILSLRKSASLTQEQLSAELGVTPQSVSNWERGGAPDISMLSVIANFFGISIDELMGNDQKSTSQKRSDFFSKFNKLSNTEEKLDFILEEYRKNPRDCLIIYNLIMLLPCDRKENIVFIEELSLKLLSESNDPDLCESVISMMARLSKNNDREKWLGRLPRRILCRQQMIRKRCLVECGDFYGAAVQTDILAAINIDEFCMNVSPDEINPKEKAKRTRKEISIIESLFENGNLPEAWFSLYAYKKLVLSACLFGTEDESHLSEAWRCFDTAITYFEKWFRIPEDAKLKTGFGDICFTKDRKFVVYPDGKLEYIGYCTNPSGNISPDYLLNCCLSKNSRWKWFDSVRRDIRFVNALNWLEAMINK